VDTVTGTDLAGTPADLFAAHANGAAT
jgi:hypothetical protein